MLLWLLPLLLLLHLQIAEGLHWLGSEAGLVHRHICPDSILIGRTGAAQSPCLRRLSRRSIEEV